MGRPGRQVQPVADLEVDPALLRGRPKAIDPADDDEHLVVAMLVDGIAVARPVRPVGRGRGPRPEACLRIGAVPGPAISWPSDRYATVTPMIRPTDEGHRRRERADEHLARAREEHAAAGDEADPGPDHEQPDEARDEADPEDRGRRRRRGTG